MVCTDGFLKNGFGRGATLLKRLKYEIQNMNILQRCTNTEKITYPLKKQKTIIGLISENQPPVTWSIHQIECIWFVENWQGLDVAG